MASSFLQLLTLPNSLHSTHLSLNQPTTIPSTLKLQTYNLKLNSLTTKCTSTPQHHQLDNTTNTNTNNSTPSFPTPESSTLNNTETFPIEKRRRSEIVRDRESRKGLVKPEPPNFEIGWKRTKEINLEKPVGYVIMDFLDKLVGLMDREFGSTELLAKAGEIVAERAREEAEVLRDEGKVEEKMVTELSRVLKLMEMDLAMVKASVKEETLRERLEQAKARCRQAILVANSF